MTRAARITIAALLVASSAQAATLTNGTAYRAGELPPAFTPADMWAYTVLQDHPLPPLEYDHAYQGSVVVYQASDQADMRYKCNRTDRSGRSLRGLHRGWFL